MTEMEITQEFNGLLFIGAMMLSFTIAIYLINYKGR